MLTAKSFTYQSQHSNVVWQLGVYSTDGMTLLRNLAAGSNSATNALLAACDLSTLQNGSYDLRLTVTSAYIETNVDVQFILDSGLKLGQFSFSQQDLVLPVDGIPLTVTRTYSSLNPDKGDFGYGWTFAINAMDVSVDETRQNMEDLDGNIFSQRAGGGRDVTLTLPNGQRTTFYFQLQAGGGLGAYQATWQAEPGVTAQLTTSDDNQLETIVGGLSGNANLYYWDAAGPETPMDTFDFSGFLLTMQDGTRYTISRQDLGEHFIDDGAEGYYVHAYGAPALSKIWERNGDTIQIGTASIIYTATNGATRQVAFQRNAAGLITSISDPNGGSNGPPAARYQYDDNNNLISVLNLMNAGSGAYVTNSFSYTNANFPHYITGIINGNGTQVAENFYDSSGRLTGVQDANGNVTHFFHSTSNDMEVVVDRLGNTNSYVYDPRGNVIVQTNALSQVTQMAYDTNNNKTNEITFLGSQPYATNVYIYDSTNQLLVSYDPLGHTNSFTYDGSGDLLISTDARGNPTTNTYDTSGNLIATSDALGDTTANYYLNGLLMGSRDAIGTVTTNTYDTTNNNLIATATLSSGVILSSNTFTYDADGNRLTSTVWRQVSGSWVGATTRYVYDSMNRVTQTTNPDSGTNTVIYNAIGKQAATVDPLGHTNSYTYDAQGRLIQTTYADGTIESSTYDANGNRATSTDQLGRTTTYLYDALNRLYQTIYPDNTTNSTMYDGVGRVAQSIDARSIVTAYSYDAAGRRLAVTNAFGITGVQNVSSYTYDPNGNQITFTDANNHTTTNVFDALNRQIRTLYPNSTTNSVVYDADGRKVAQTNQDGVVTLSGYDGTGRLTTVTNAFNTAQTTVTRYVYDQAGNETAQVDALNRTNLFAYDGMGRRIAHTLPGNQSETFSYDTAGNLTQQTNFDNGIITCEYDALNRLTNRSSTGSYNIYDIYTYTSTGQRQSMVDNSGGQTTYYYYDSRDRLIQKVVTWNNGNGPNASLYYAYDANGNVTNLQSSSVYGVGLAYGYDALNRLTNVLSHGQSAASYGYDLAGNLQTMRYGNGVTNLYQYDTLNRLTNLVWNSNGITIASFAYQLKAAGTRTNLSETVNGTSRTCQWQYDNLYRLTNENISAIGTVGYVYDAVGNRTSRAVSGSLGLTNQTFSYDTNDFWTAASHDGDYNIGGFAGNTYSYDSLNRLISATVNGNTINLVTDGDGNRMEKTVGNVTTYYLVDDRNPSGYAQVVEEYQSLNYQSATLNRAYNYGQGLISQQQFNTNTFLPSTLSYYGYDGHGSVRFLMSTNGSITDTYTYDAFGTLIAETPAPGSQTPNNYLYSGQQYDPDIGLYYNRARYLSTDTGRFWSRDSVDGNNEDPLSLHKYLYCQGNPVNGVDPSGHEDVVGIDMDFSIGNIGFGFSVAAAFGLGPEQENDFSPNWAAGKGDVMHNLAWDEIKLPSGSGSQIANQMYGDLQQFRYFYPHNTAQVRPGWPYTFFTPIGGPGAAIDLINPSSVAVQLVNGPGQDELSAVTLGHHMLVGIRRWRVKIVHQNPPDLLVETEAYDQDNGRLNQIGRNFPFLGSFGITGYGQGKQYETWHDYLNNIGSHWVNTAGATSSGEDHIQAQDTGTTQNPWRSQLPASLQ
jgi:RHS repeat-associated protein